MPSTLLSVLLPSYRASPLTPWPASCAQLSSLIGTVLMFLPTVPGIVFGDEKRQVKPLEVRLGGKNEPVSCRGLERGKSKQRVALASLPPYQPYQG